VVAFTNSKELSLTDAFYRDETVRAGCSKHSREIEVESAEEATSWVSLGLQCSNHCLTVMNVSNLSVDAQTSGNFIHHQPPQPIPAHLPACVCAFVSASLPLSTSVQSLSTSVPPHSDVTYASADV